jgi:hypothetical protein
MPSTIKVYRHGTTAGVRPNGCEIRGLRGEVQGWTVASSRSNTRFLYSVREPDLTGFGLALSLTVRDCPATDRDWFRLRQAFLKRMWRLGMVRCHWITEWQKRGVPHMHSAMWFEDPGDGRGRHRLALFVVGEWLELANTSGLFASQGGQHVAPITDEVGWLKYLAKHAARGAQHYQRAAEAIPEGWRKTGRMWGHLGPWPCEEPLEVELDALGWYRFRRLHRSYRIAQARASKDRRSVRFARRMLRCPFREVAHLRGISGWVPQAVSLRMLEVVANLGGQVTS